MNQQPNSVIFFRNDNGILCYSFNDKVYKINLQGDSFKVNQKISTVIDNTGLISFIKTADGIPTFIYKPQSQQIFVKGGGGGGGVLAFIGGGGDNNYIAKFSPDGTHLADSLLYDNGTSIGFGTTSPNANSTFDIQSTTKGILFPRMTTVQRNAIAAPTDGLFVYNTTTKLFSYWDSNAGTWQNIDSQAGGDVSGSGTTNFVMKWTDGPNSVAGDSQIIDDGTNVGIGINPGLSKLHVAGAIRTGVASTTNGSLIFQNSTNANTLTINAGVFGANITWTLPTDQGGVSSVLTNDGTGILSWGSAVTADWQLNGNTVGSEKFIGTLDAFAFPIRTNNVERGRIDSAGLWAIGSSITTASTILAVTGAGTTSASYSAQFFNSTPSIIMAIRNDRKVGIGTTSINSFLTIDNSGNANSASLDIQHNGGLGGMIIFNRSAITDDNFGMIWETGGNPKWFTGMSQNSENYYFKQNTSTGAKILSLIQATGNIGIGTDIFGTNATQTLGIINGTAPTTSPVGMIQIFSVNDAGAKATFGLRTEEVVTNGAAAQASYLPILINGTEFKLLLG